MKSMNKDTTDDDITDAVRRLRHIDGTKLYELDKEW